MHNIQSFTVTLKIRSRKGHGKLYFTNDDVYETNMKIYFNFVIYEINW